MTYAVVWNECLNVYEYIYAVFYSFCYLYYIVLNDSQSLQNIQKYTKRMVWIYMLFLPKTAEAESHYNLNAIKMNKHLSDH